MTFTDADIRKSTGPRSSTSKNSGGPMKILIMPVLLSGKKIPVASPSMGILMLKKIRSCKNFGGPVKLGFSMWLLVLQSSKGPIVFPVSADGNYFRVSINQSIFPLCRVRNPFGTQCISNTFLHVDIDFRFHSTVYSLILILDIKFCDCILLQHRVHTEGVHLLPRACRWMATEMTEVSNRVNFGSKPGHLTCPEKSRQRADLMIMRLVRKKGAFSVGNMGLASPDKALFSVTWWPHINITWSGPGRSWITGLAGISGLGLNSEPRGNNRSFPETRERDRVPVKKIGSRDSIFGWLIPHILLK